MVGSPMSAREDSPERSSREPLMAKGFDSPFDLIRLALNQRRRESLTRGQ